MRKPLIKKLLQMEVELHSYRKDASTFPEEAVINHVMYALGRALDVLNNKTSFLQGLNGNGEKGE